MTTIRAVSTADALPFQRQLALHDCCPSTGRHRLEYLAERLGVYDGDTLISMVRLLPLDPAGRNSVDHLRLEGPFTLPDHPDHRDALLAAALRRVHPVDGSRQTRRIWRYTPPKPPEPSGRHRYSASDIMVLSGLMAVRKRPGMYIGGVGEDGQREMVFEVVSNTLDEHLAGHASLLRIDHADGTWTLSDDGRGIPVAPLNEDGESPLELFMTRLFAGPFRGQSRVHAHAGRRGLGLTILNALTETCTVTVERPDGTRCTHTYSRGLPTGFLTTLPATGQTGTTFTFRPDMEIFEETLSPEALRPRLLELSGQLPGLAIELDGERLHLDGLIGLAAHRAGEELTDVRLFEGQRDGVLVQGLLGRSGSDAPRVFSYCNLSSTPEGGSHVEGAQAALGELLGAGSVLLVAVRLEEVRFASRTRDRLDVPEIVSTVSEIVRESLG